MKLFNLIHGEQISLEETKRVIPQEQVTELLDATGIKKKALEDAKGYKLAVLKEMEKEKAKAQEAGFKAGMMQWNDKLAYLEKEIQAVHNEVKKVIIPLAIKAAQKIVGKSIEANPELVVDIVSNSLKSVAQHKKVALFVNQNDLAVLEGQKSRLKAMLEHADSFTIQARDDVQPNGCIIETEIGIINAQLSTQWEAMEAAFQTLWK